MLFYLIGVLIFLILFFGNQLGDLNGDKEKNHMPQGEGLINITLEEGAFKGEPAGRF